MLQVKQNYLFENETPFFWLGDTAWLLTEKLTKEEIFLYLDNRAYLKYNVIQMVLFYSLPEGVHIQGEMKARKKEIYSKEYFQLVNEVIAYAKNLGIYIALLPCWGSFVKNGILKDNDVDRFSTFLVNEFAKNDNLIWVLGGDVNPTSHLSIYNHFGSKLKELDKKHLITFHPFGRTLSARWFNDEPWLDFNMFQSGHRRYDQGKLNYWDDQMENYYGEDNYFYVQENNSYTRKLPCLDAEPSYEGIVQGLHDPREPYWEAADVRRYAYWSVFEGACGFTYGNNAIIQFYTKEDGAGSYGVRETWQEGLSSEGGAQMQYLRKLMESVPFWEGKPMPSLLKSPAKERYYHLAIFAGNDFVFVYDYMGDKFALDLSSFQGMKLDAYWMNPQNDSLSYFANYEANDVVEFFPPRRHELSNDWVLVLKKKVLK